MIPHRRLVYAFCGLPVHLPAKVVAELALTEVSDLELSEDDRRLMYCARAQEKDLLAELETLVKRAASS